MPRPALSSREPLELLAEQFAREQRDGLNPSIDDYARRHPDSADEIRELFPALMIMEALAPGQETQVRLVDDTHVGFLPLDLLGDYQIEREIGRGGMGIVYQARQRSLSRRVALKVLPFHSLKNEELRARFQREAEAAGRLDHPHIVSVYEVGEHQGCPYFSMKYVDGPTLADRLAGGPLPPREAISLVLPIAGALEAAHRCGVLHRDIKPSNILIDSQGQPLVADFGLAKTFQPGGDASRTQGMIGTPSYMAPEQAGGGPVSTATDVYGLGALLYHLLTGRPPFQAATALETLRQVLHQEPVPPRQLNGTISRDVETICLKCLTKEPRGRYESAAALAEDLQRASEGRPILARRLGRAARMARWCHRYPMRATALGLLILTCCVSLAAYMTTSAALQDSRRSYARTRDVVDFYLRRVSEDPRFQSHAMQPLRRDLLHEALAHYQRFLEEQRSDAALGDDLADTHFHLGLIKEQIDSPQEALASYREAERIQRQLTTRTASVHARATLSKTLSAIGRVHAGQGERDEARANYGESLRIREQLMHESPADREYARLLANARMNLGLLDQDAGDFEAAGRQYNDAELLRRKLLEKRPGDWLARRDLAKGLYNEAALDLAIAASEMSNLNSQSSIEPLTSTSTSESLTNAERKLSEAIGLFDALCAEEPDNPDLQWQRSLCWRLLADVKTRCGAEDAAQWYIQVISQLEELALTSPQIPDYQAIFAGACLNLGQAEFGAGRVEMAIDRFHQARRASEILVRLQGDMVGHRLSLAMSERAIGELEAARKNFQIAQHHLTKAQGQWDGLMAEFPGREEYAMHGNGCRQALAQIERILNLPDEAKP